MAQVFHMFDDLLVMAAGQVRKHAVGACATESFAEAAPNTHRRLDAWTRADDGQC